MGMLWVREAGNAIWEVVVGSLTLRLCYNGDSISTYFGSSLSIEKNLSARASIQRSHLLFRAIKKKCDCRTGSIAVSSSVTKCGIFAKRRAIGGANSKVR